MFWIAFYLKYFLSIKKIQSAMKQMMAELNANIAAIVLHSTGSTQEVFLFC